MNRSLLHEAVQDYLWLHSKADIQRVVLGKSPFRDISTQELAEQLECREKARIKLPTWYGKRGIYYPGKLNIEQSSSEITAAYKANIVRATTVADLTGGFGVDSFYFARQATRVCYCEQDTGLAGIAAHNFGVLGATNIEVYPTDGLKWLQHSRELLDLIYIDPSRRSESKKRVFLLSDCIPDVVKYRELLLHSSRNVLVKSSPLLDLSAGMRELEAVKEIHIVAVTNEVKEVLWLLEKGMNQSPLVKTINIKAGHAEEFEFFYDTEKEMEISYSEPLTFLYEPNAAIMKSGGYKSLGSRFQLQKLHEHTHLYTSTVSVNFPGRSFRVRGVYPFKPRNIRKLRLVKANVSVRNFPHSVRELRKKFGIEDGGPVYLFFTRTTGKGLIVIECEKI